jgi:hypothetical protein
LNLMTGMSSPVDTHGNLGAKGFNVISLIKPLDKATPKLLQAYADS